MKLNVTVSNHQYEVELYESDAQLIALVDGEQYELMRHTAPDDAASRGVRTYLLTLANRVYECAIAPASAGGVEVTIGSTVYQARVSDPRALPTSGAASGGASGRARIIAPMPGKIVRVLVEAGARVEAGDSLVVVEAMKMQNEMKAPNSGTIVELHARAGATVQAGDVLIVIE